MKQILIASSNPGKIREIKEILKGVPFELKTMDEIGFNEEIPETGETFEENAIIKAKTIGEKTKLLTLAEDSGLEVDALEGRPGIYSARYANGSDLNRIDKLLKELKRIPKEKRTARFRAVVALYIPTSVIPNASEGSLADASSDKLR
ncbi:non-canonical purine NTP pyrophosphatase, partial [Candidatus Gottesmanbacteria bacterium]|nr:non-canonical purine NTP pyrophosphatase [Candidatus Gottesmanbacteria bacterium]